MTTFPETMYKRGLAIGEADIRNDAMHFRFKEELFTLSTFDAMKVAKYNGYWYEAPVKKLRALKRKR